MLLDSSSSWFSLPQLRYEDLKSLVLNQSWKISYKRQSFWWRDLTIAIGNGDKGVGWFDNNVSCKLGGS